MKLRIANIGIPAIHESMTSLLLRSSQSISDFDALVFHPFAVGAELGGDIGMLLLKQSQVKDLLNVKAGVVIAMLSPSAGGVHQGSRYFDGYYLIESAIGKAEVVSGSGTVYKVAPGASSAGLKYFRALDGHLQFEGHLANVPTHARVIAHNSVGQIVAAQFPAGGGKVIVLPSPTNISAARIGAALVEVVNALLKDDDPEVSEPEWAASVVVPGSGAHDPRIVELRNRQKELKEELKQLEAARLHLLKFKGLLYGTGKAVLETAVRAAFRLLGFEVPEPEEYSGEWDVALSLSDGRTAIGEVEGAEGVGRVAHTTMGAPLIRVLCE